MWNVAEQRRRDARERDAPDLAAARHLDSYEDALWTAADRDTLAAIVGGIVVLATGVDAIPATWREATASVT